MTKLHEVLAVEGDKEGIAKKILAETKKVFNAKHLFTGFHKRLEMIASGQEAIESAAEEHTEIATTVRARLDYTAEALGAYYDVVLQKEATNASVAKADLIVDGITLGVNLPATFLLGLESKLKTIRAIYDDIPTLEQGISWELDHGNALPDVYRAKHDEIKTKTRKDTKFSILVEPTQHHPAQVEKWMEEDVVGNFITTKMSALLPPAEKSAIIGRLDKVIQATKQARMRANNVDIMYASIGAELFGYIHG